MSFTPDEIEDLKQLFIANNGVLLTELEQRFKKIDQHLETFEQKFDDLSDSVQEAIDTSNDASGQQLADHEQRITKFEQATAS